MTEFHRWLIKQRVYCERGGLVHFAPATTVIKDEKNRDICVCDLHAGKTSPDSSTSATRIDAHIGTSSYTISQTEEWDYKPSKKRTATTT